MYLKTYIGTICDSLTQQFNKVQFENLLSIAFYNASTYCRSHVIFICNYLDLSLFLQLML